MWSWNIKGKNNDIQVVAAFLSQCFFIIIFYPVLSQLSPSSKEIMQVFVLVQICFVVFIF